MTGRFLNADSYINPTGDILGYNMYAYCGNNPVMGYDPMGEWNWGKFWSGLAMVGAATLCVVSVAASIVTCGAASPLVVATAALTITAATAYAVEGVAEIIEAGTGENFVRDGVFNGDETAYETSKVVLSTIMEFGNAVVGVSACFIAGTLILTESGYLPIEQITVGMAVYATDPETGETALKEVVQLFRNETDEWIHLTVDGEEIVCTPGHPFYSPVKGWTSACQLRAGDILVTVNGEYVVVEQIQHEILESPETTYNFEVADFHTYYVGDTKVLVHNKCGIEHGNSLKTSKPAQGYVLKDKTTNEILKFGETTRGTARYSKSFLASKNAYMEFVQSGTKAEMHLWQHNMIEGYVYIMGQLPPLNRSLW